MVAIEGIGVRLAALAVAGAAACNPPTTGAGSASAASLGPGPTESGTGGSTTAAPPDGQSSGVAEGDATAGSSTAVADDTSGDTSESGGPLRCDPVPDCLAVPPPNAGPTISWEHTESYLVEASGSPRHRGRDMFYNPDEPHWAMAKFAYGLTDWDLEDERVDLFLLRNCEGEWESLGIMNTTYEDDHPTVDGVEDSGGRIYFPLPEPLPLGRHRIHMVVRGDDSRADTYIEVVEPGTPIFLSDIDGTLTTAEWERLVDFLLDSIPEVNVGAPQALHLLAERGYRPMYLTARPEFLGNRTYQFIEDRGLPPGIIHTTLSATGAMGTAAVDYKTAEFAALADRGLVPAWVFGNTDSDGEAYENAGIMPLSQRVFFQHEDAFGGRTIESYLDLLPELSELPPVCE